MARNKLIAPYTQNGERLATEGRYVFMLTLYETFWQHQLLTFMSRWPTCLPLPQRIHCCHVVAKVVNLQKHPVLPPSENAKIKALRFGLKPKFQLFD